MSMTDWSKREVEIACKIEREANGTPEGEWDYGCACYESALKAYNILAEEGHSGYSWGITRNILMRLMDGKVLTPIEDTADIWNECGYRESYHVMYQCKRMSSLFKDVYADGTVKYHDTNRYYCFDINNPNVPYSTGLCVNIVDEMFPITMPYCPPDKPYKVVCETLLTDPKNGDFEIRAILYIIDPDGNKIEVNRYFDCRGEGWKEVDLEAYNALRQKALSREE